MQLIERQYQSRVNIDREAGVIRGVKIIGTKSANHRTYPIDVLAKAAPLYENRPVNINHLRNTKEERSVRDTFGVITGVRVQRNGASPGLFGDLQYLKSHAMAEQVLETAERFPHLFGLSHDADGKANRAKDGHLMVEAIERVNSVDLVQEPATNSSLFEGLDTRDENSRLPDSSPEGAIKTAFRNQLVAVFDDGSLDRRATLARISELLRNYERILAGMSRKSTATPAMGTSQDVAESLMRAGRFPTATFRPLASTPPATAPRVPAASRECPSGDRLLESLGIFNKRPESSNANAARTAVERLIRAGR